MTGDQRQRTCQDACNKTSKACSDERAANYKACVASNTTQTQQETKELKLSGSPAPTSSKSSTDYTLECWNKQIDGNAICGKANTQCLYKCVSVDSSERNTCMNQCGKVSDDCRKPVWAEYDACMEAGKKANQAKPSYIIEMNDFLDGLEKTEQAIDQCSPPRVPSESKCVSDALLQFDLPTYLRDVSIEPDFTNTIVLDDNSKIQIITFTDEIKSVPDYMMNTISSNFDYRKKFEDLELDMSQIVPSLELLPAYPSNVPIPQSQYAIVDRVGQADVTIPSKDEPSNLISSGRWESVSNLIRLDEDEREVGKIEGPSVDKIAKILADSNAKITLMDSTNRSIMEISNGAKVVVAGYAADDTLEAAKDFVSQLLKK